MYRIPKDLDLSPIIGEFTTQLRIGPSDIQFTFGKVNFAVQSTIILKKEGEEIGTWTEGEWPSPTFYEILNSEVKTYETYGDDRISIKLENEIEIILVDNSDQYESMQISIEGTSCNYII